MASLDPGFASTSLIYNRWIAIDRVIGVPMDLSENTEGEGA